MVLVCVVSLSVESGECCCFFFFFQAEDGIRDLVRSRGLGDVYKRQVLRGVEIFIPLEGLIDLEVERQKIQKEITRLEGSLAGIEKKLSNEKFVANASPEVVEKELSLIHI